MSASRATCAVDECETLAKCRGYCQPHYMRLYRHGDPTLGQDFRKVSGARLRNRSFHIWRAMIARCTNPRDAAFKNYGARGITICDRWRIFENFLADMGERPPGMQIERGDNDRGYEPDNCRWATPLEQGQNKRNNRVVTVGGETFTISEWSRRNSIKLSTIWQRLKAGWPQADAVSAPTMRGARRGIPRGQRTYTLKITDHHTEASQR